METRPETLWYFGRKGSKTSICLEDRSPTSGSQFMAIKIVLLSWLKITHKFASSMYGIIVYMLHYCLVVLLALRTFQTPTCMGYNLNFQQLDFASDKDI